MNNRCYLACNGALVDIELIKRFWETSMKLSFQHAMVAERLLQRRVDVAFMEIIRSLTSSFI